MPYHEQWTKNESKYNKGIYWNKKTVANISSSIFHIFHIFLLFFWGDFYGEGMISEKESSQMQPGFFCITGMHIFLSHSQDFSFDLNSCEGRSNSNGRCFHSLNNLYVTFPQSKFSKRSRNLLGYLYQYEIKRRVSIEMEQFHLLL